MNYCSECRHRYTRSVGDWYIYDCCARYDRPETSEDPVTGVSRFVVYSICKDVRGDEKRCGMEGRLFQPSLMTRLRRLLFSPLSTWPSTEEKL